VKRLLTKLANNAWIASCRRDHDHLLHALDHTEETQAGILLNLVRQNANTVFGKKHNFDSIHSVSNYRIRVPVANYEDFRDKIMAIANGGQNVLTASPITRLHPTSGTIAGTKLIPWNATVAHEFNQGINAWIYALHRSHPGLASGTAYWSVTPPVFRSKTNDYRLPVGFDDDASYLGVVSRSLFSLVNSVPSSIARESHPDSFQIRLLAALLADPNLSLISVWSPTFLDLLLDKLVTHREELLARLSATTPAWKQSRKRRVAEILKSLPPVEWPAALWPNLQVVSCWMDGPSKLPAQHLKQRLPVITFQPKGLVATEAFVSLPLLTNSDPVLAATSHFYEFEEVNSGTVCLAHETKPGGIYRLIVTTGGGLYRYALNDRVEVTGRIGTAPTLCFIGRDGNASDLCGEKLSGSHVTNVVERLLALWPSQRVRFWLVAPVMCVDGPPAYTLFLETDGTKPTPSTLATLSDQLETGFQENFHYNHCRNLGQLGRVGLFLIAPADSVNGSRGAAVFQLEMLSRGLKLGDIKPAPLDARPGWEKRLQGRFVISNRHAASHTSHQQPETP